MAKADGSDIAKKTATGIPGGAPVENSKALSPTQQKNKSINAFVESMKSQIARALPAGMNADRMARLVLTTIRINPKLMDCTPASLAGAMLQSAQLGLEFGPLGHAYLVPYNNKKANRMDAQLIIGYRGLLTLAGRSKECTAPYAELVYSKDTFEVTYGLHRDIKHTPPPFGEERGEVVGAYAVSTLLNGPEKEKQFVVMTLAEIQKIRRRSMASDSGPWVTDFEAMCRKTVVKQLCKWLPLSTEIQRQIAADETVKTEISDDILDLPSETEDNTIEAEATVVEEEASPAATDTKKVDPLAGGKDKK